MQVCRIFLKFSEVDKVCEGNEFNQHSVELNDLSFHPYFLFVAPLTKIVIGNELRSKEILQTWIRKTRYYVKDKI